MKLEALRQRFRPQPPQSAPPGADKRPCTICAFSGNHSLIAKYVVTGLDGRQWFECGIHEQGEREIMLGVKSVRSESLKVWLAAIRAGVGVE